MKKRQYLVVLFLVLLTTIFFILKYEKDKKIDIYIKNKTKQYTLTYNSIYNQYKQRANIIFNTKIDKKKILELVESQDREALYNYLKDDYAVLKQYNLKQLHFHLPNNESFLRFHRPNKHGDNLTNIRPTVKYVNKYKKAIDGFEEGRIYNGYRFVYPLFLDKVHIGSVEVSFSAYSFVSKVMDDFKVSSNFLISKDVVDEKVFNSEKSNYMKSTFDDFYFEKSIMEIIYEKYPNKYRFLSKDMSAYIANLLFLDKSCGVYDNRVDKLVVCIPISNPVTKKVVAAIMIDGDTSYIHNKTLNFYIAFFIFGLFLFIVFYILYREVIFKRQLKENNQKLQTVIDEADSGIALINLEGDFLEVNNMYTKFLGYTKDEFKKLNCIELTNEHYKLAAIDMLEKAIKTGRVSKFRKICIRKDGSSVHLELSLNILPNKDSFVAVVNSLEDKIQIENALSKFEYIFNFTSIGFLVVDKNRYIQDINPILCEIFGYKTKDELVGKDVEILYINNDAYQDFTQRVLVQSAIDETIKIRFEFKKKDESTIWCELSGSPQIQDGDVVWSVIDITDSIIADNLISRQNKKIEQIQGKN